MEATGKGFWDEVEMISVYTRAEALSDGYLVDVTETAKEAGFIFPVAVTFTVWADCIEWTDGDSARQTHQDQSGRLWDVLFMAMHRIRTSSGETDCLMYKIGRIPRGGRTTRAQEVELKIMIGGGDNGEPVMTIMQPDED